MKNFKAVQEDQLATLSDSLVFITCLSENSFQKIGSQIDNFYFTEGVAPLIVSISPDVSRDTFLKILVPLLEANNCCLILTENDEVVLHTIQCYRYKGQPFIFNSVSEDCRDINSFYNISKTVPNTLENILISNLARLDFTALQIHQIHPDAHTLLQKTNSRILRLGQIRENSSYSEPVLRDANVINFQISSLKYSEAPSRPKISQSGLFSEEACQIMRYAGISDKLSSCIISGLSQDVALDDQTANVLAQMVWYFTEAYHIRKGDFPGISGKMTEYLVAMDELEEDLVFIKSEKSGRWWIKCSAAVDPEFASHAFFPVNYEDYAQASEGHISDNVVQAMMWFNALPAPSKVE